jgi:rRNA maturation RNase YbeY
VRANLTASRQQAGPAPSLEHSIFFVPRRTTACTRILEEEGVLGDLVLCPVVAERQGEAAGHGTVAELDLLTVHGVLHLLGYAHAEPEEHKEMFGLQDELLAAWRSSLG